MNDIIDPSAIIVILGLFAMLLLLSLDKMRPGFTLFAGAIIFMAFGIISPRELLEGFSNKAMILVAMLFLIGEGARQSGALRYAVRNMLPRRRRRVGSMLAQILPIITSLSMVLNNTAVVIIFAPIIKRWANRIGVPATKFLIPLSYATILGGVCTLVGTSTNMVVNGMMIDAGYRGFSMFEIGQVGIVIALVGTIYLIIFANTLLPGGEDRATDSEDGSIEVVLTTRFPGIGMSLKEFGFTRHYGVEVLAVIKGGERIEGDEIGAHLLSMGDALILKHNERFLRTWRESSAFHIISADDDDEMEAIIQKQRPRVGRRSWLGMGLMIFLIGGTALSEYFSSKIDGVVPLDFFSLAAIVMVIMALGGFFPVKRYTKFISWDVLVAIAAAFAISKAMSNSGINDLIASWIISTTVNLGNVGVLALLYLVTMLLSEFITNNAAVAIAFPVAMALGQQLGIDPMPLFVAICIAASASFSSPIGYQTNLIVQGVGGYKFIDYLRIGIWLNLITFIISITLIPRIWSF